LFRLRETDPHFRWNNGTEEGGQAQARILPAQKAVAPEQSFGCVTHARNRSSAGQKNKCVMLAAGCLFRAAGFLTLVLYAMNRCPPQK